MSDFLSNLAARHLGRARAVQPRLAARFEQASDSAVARRTPAVEIVEAIIESQPSPGIEQPPHRPTGPPATDPRLGTTAPSAAPPPLPVRAAPSQPSLSPANPPITQSVPPSLVVQAVEQPAIEQPMLAPPKVPAATAPPPPPAITALGPPRAPGPDPVRPVLRAVPTPAAEALPTVSPRPGGRVPIDPVEREISSSAKRDDQVVVDLPLRDKEAAIAPASVRAASAAPTPADETAVEKTDAAIVEPRAAPVIRVTIGRIEVRAVAPPAPPEPRRAPPPALSLEEYLRRGGRP
jgi:hypothetical protein